jgi:hypothetical protein
MKVDSASLGYSARKNFGQRGFDMPLGHVHQLVAAGFGHKTLASFQSSNDINRIGEAAFFLIDEGLIARRFEELQGVSGESAVEVIAEAIRSRLEFASFPSGCQGLVSELLLYVNSAVPRHSGVLSLLEASVVEPIGSLTLGALHEQDLSFDIDVPVDGYVHAGGRGRQDVTVSVRARLHLERIGNRMFSGPWLQLGSARRA